MFADAPHLLKLTRNWLLDHGFYLGDSTEIDKSPLHHLLDTTTAEVNVLYKVTRKHLTLEKTKRQNVRMAAELLSHNTATALMRYQPGPNKQLAVNLSNFIETTNTWFDIFNSYVPNDKIPTKSAYGTNLQQQSENLDKMYDMVKNMRARGYRTLQTFQKGILISISSLKLLYTDMQNKYNIRYICSNKLNQDSLENFFFQVRNRGGADEHPSPLNAIKRMRLIILGKNPGILHAEVNTEDHTNEEYLVATVCKEADVIVDNPELLDHDGHGSDSDSNHSYLSNVSSSSGEIERETTTDALEYIAGYLAKKFKDANLDHPLDLGDYTKNSKSVRDYDLPSWVRQLSYGGLIQPSNEWLKKVVKFNKYFLKYHGEHFKKETNTVKMLSFKIKKQERDVPITIIKAFVKLRIIIRINYLNLKTKQNNEDRARNRKMRKITK